MSHKNLKRFYDSRHWKRTRLYVLTRDRGVCKECGKVGNHVHHIKPLTIYNVDNYDVALNPDNLELLCTSCHTAKHSKGSKREDVDFDAQGNLIKRK